MNGDFRSCVWMRSVANEKTITILQRRLFAPSPRASREAAGPADQARAATWSARPVHPVQVVRGSLANIFPR
jgi:hypothetical protein